MHLHERGLIASGKRDASRSVRFVANDDVELGEPFPLGSSDHVQRLVGAQHDPHGITVRVVREALEEFFGIGCGRF